MITAARKEHFYSQLATLLEAGMPVVKAAEHLTKHSSGSLGEMAGGMQRGLTEGMPLADAMKFYGGPDAELLDIAVLRSAERGGKLEIGARYLVDYYRMLTQVWKQWRHAMAYPLIVLHAALLLPAVSMVGNPDASFWKLVGIPVCIVYLFAGFLFVMANFFYRQAADNESLDSLANHLPFLGSFRRNLAQARFCQALEIQLQTGGNVSEAVKTAGQAAATAKLKHDAAEMAETIATQGCPLGPLLLKSGAISPTLAQSLNTSEAVGRLDVECGVQAHKFMEAAEQSAVLCGIWIPKLLYVVIAVFAIYKIFTFYLGGINSTLEGFSF